MHVIQNNSTSENLADIYRSVFEASGDAMYLMQDHAFVHCNQALLDLLGCTREQLFARTPSDFSPEFQPNGMSSWDLGVAKLAAVTTTNKQSFEFTYARLDGTAIPADVTLSRVEIESQVYVLVTARNVSRRKAVEHEVALSRKRILEQNKGLTLLNQLSNQLQGLYTPDEIYQNTIDTMAKVLPKPRISIFTIDRENGLLYFNTARRHKQENIEKLKVIPLNRHFHEIAEKTGESIDIPDISQNQWIIPEVKAALLNMGFRSMIIVPFILQETRSALMYLVYEELGEMHQEDMSVLNSISKTVSLALDNAHTHSELDYMAHHDSLTGLSNRAFFHKEFAASIQADALQTAALYLLDLDRFKEINDTLGHFTGDKLLQKIGPRLENSIEGYNFFVSRLGGDEFAVCVYGVKDKVSASEVAKQILNGLREPFQVEDVSLEIDSSIGIALYPQDGGDSHALLRSADVAMYQAKKNGLGYRFYEPETDIHTPERLAMIAELGSSIHSGQLYLHYQPKIELQNNKILGFEALARWEHPRLGALSPSVFVPLIEASNLIFQLTEEVLHQALMQQRQWRRDGFDYTVAVNLSARNLIDERIVKLLKRLLITYETPVNMLELEITETALMQDLYRASTYLKQISDLGVQLSIDDFGTGYSSLAYLIKLPVNKIKLDREFIMGMLNSVQGENIVSTIIQLSNELNLEVIAEGVEDKETLEKLRDMGCDQAQGYYICRPNDWAKIEKWLLKTK